VLRRLAGALPAAERDSPYKLTVWLPSRRAVATTRNRRVATPISQSSGRIDPLQEPSPPSAWRQSELGR
jgi:hypothetical protein